MKHPAKISLITLAVQLALAPWLVHSAVVDSQTKVNPSPIESKQKLKTKKPDEQIEVMQIVSSYTESLTEANLQKQHAIGVSDVIVADDISKFPDNNLAEALQRMTGIAIDRNHEDSRFKHALIPEKILKYAANIDWQVFFRRRPRGDRSIFIQNKVFIQRVVLIFNKQTSLAKRPNHSVRKYIIRVW